MDLAEFVLEKKVIMYICIIILLVGGIWGFQSVGRLEDPDFVINEVRINTPYPGATAIEVEEEVGDLIEAQVQKLPDLWWVDAESQAGVSIITARFQEGISAAEYRQIYDELRRKVNDVQDNLPPGAGPSIVNDDFKDVFGIMLAITGDGFNEKELYDHSELVLKTLAPIPGVSKIEYWGEPQETIFIETSRAKIVTLGLSEDYLYNLIQDQNLVARSGDVTVGRDRLQIVVSGDYDTVESIGAIVVSSGQDSQIRLSDIATIYRGYKDPPDTRFRFNGRPGMVLAISAMTTENVVEIGKKIDVRLADLEAVTPVGIEVEKIISQPDIVDVSVNSFLMSLVQAVAIVVGLLLVFMGLQSGLVIGFMLILIIAGTLMLMGVFNITLQRISLGALIIAMGMLVDNSIVITEGMLVRMQKGEDSKKAAKAVVGQQSMPLFGATVVAILAFASVGMSADATGDYTRTLFWVVIISLLLSWILAITVNPLVVVQFMKIKPIDPNAPIKTKRFDLMGSFRGLLAGSIRNKWLVAGISAGLLVLSGWGFTRLTQAFFPASSQPTFLVDYWLPEGTDIYATESDMIALENELMNEELFPEIKKVATYVGGPAPRFQLTFTPEKANPRYGMYLIEVHDAAVLEDLVPRIQEHIDDYYPEAQGQALRIVIGPGAKGMVNARFRGPDADVLRELSQQVKEIYFRTGNAVAIRDNWGERAKVIQVSVDEVQARRLGIARPDINQALLQAFRGREVGLYREGNRLQPIVSRPIPSERTSASQITDVYVWSPILQAQVPVEQMVKGFTLEWRDNVIQRRDRERMIEVKCDPLTGEASKLRDMVKDDIEAIPLPPGYRLEWGGQFFDSNKANENLMITFPLSFLAMLITIFFLWNRIKQPIIIFLMIPLCLIGIVLGLGITSVPFSFMAIMGSLSLFGMAIKNAIVMVDEIDLTLSQGGSRFDGLVNASVTRVRPVMMAALSTVLGMIPLIGDAFFQGMAISIMFGLTIASVLTLIVLPTLYAIFFNIDGSEAVEFAG